MRKRQFNQSNDIEGFVFPTENPDYLPNLFKEIRKQADFTQQQMAEVLGTSQKVYQRWESGNTLPTGSFVAKMFLFKDFLDKQQRQLIKYTLPFEMSEAIVKRLGERVDIHQQMREKATPVIKSLKLLFFYLESFKVIEEKYVFSNYPFLMEWFPDNPISPMQVYLTVKEFGKPKLVLEARFVTANNNFDKLMVDFFLEGAWVSVIEQAVTHFVAHSYMAIDDTPFLDEFEQAFSFLKRCRFY